MKKIYIILSAFAVVLNWGCSRDSFADLNTDPKEVTKPDLRFSLSKAMEQMYEEDYTIWFYNNFQYIHPWTQVGTRDGGNTSEVFEMGPNGEQNIYKALFRQTEDIRQRVNMMEGEEKAKYDVIVAMTYPIQILPAMSNTDIYGSIVYTQAVKNLSGDPLKPEPLLTPVYDSQKTLFDTWLTELDQALNVLSSKENQIPMESQDFLFNNNTKKWAKLCNLLKLKIAARLVNADRAKALKIAEEVAASSAGYPDELNDDLIYNRGVKYYGTGNDMWIGFAGKNLVDFFIANKDPRLRFIFEKNEFNAEIVQAFIEAKKELPPYVKQYVNFDTNGNFESWKAPGEPWVRYHGAPVSPEAKYDAKNEIYFNQDALYKITLSGKEKKYKATSSFSQKQIRTSYEYTYPTRPGGRVLELKDNEPPLNVILGSAAEANLFLAEFKLLGANLPKNAQDYFNKGVILSTQRMDLVAKNNQMPYYDKDPVYTNQTEAETAATKLKSNEIDSLLANAAYDLSKDGLEKVYIQQNINYMLTPNDLWANVRRSGIPKVNSAYLPWEPMKSAGNDIVVPRRFVIKTPSADNTNYTNMIKAYKDQGFTTGTNNPQTLSTERLWFDIENPNYGAGPR